MENTLLEITAEQLLEKFGAGNHKPGSGSAAALQGMLSSKLLTTVINITNNGDHKYLYIDSLPKLLEMNDRIMKQIYPSLEKLFQDDAIQFDKTIKARKIRDSENDPIRKNLLAGKALDELKISIEIPLKISEQCIELAEIASYVFDNGFQSARGDSHVALSGAVGALGGCLAIIQLNLLSYSYNHIEWITDISKRTNELKLKFEKLNSEVILKMNVLESQVKEKASLYSEVNDFIQKIKGRVKYSEMEIENISSSFQNIIWKHKDTIWKKKIPEEPIDSLQPNTIFKKVLGYAFKIVPNLEINSDEYGTFETAGIIDQGTKTVLISKGAQNEFSRETQTFTAAHELGHALLHEQTVLHRDRPIDGLGHKLKRISQEFEADKFAACFLIPKKQIVAIFNEYFLTNKFLINQDNAFNLTFTNKGAQAALRKECKDLRGLSRKLAKAEFFAGKRFVSLSRLFNVSIETMAIRLEELDLVEF